MKARYQYRIYPTTNQKIELAKLFGCCRVVWNDALALIKATPEGEKWPSNAELQKICITQAKKTDRREWLAEVSNIPLQQSIQDLGVGFKNFFDYQKGKRKGRRVGFPRFKKKLSRQSARLTRGGFKVHQHKVYLAKIGQVKIVWSRDLPDQPSSVTVIKDSAERYFLSFVVESNPEPLPKTDASVGIDLGIKTFATLNNGEKIDAPKPLKKRIKKLRQLSKSLSRKSQGSKRYQRARLKLAKFHAKLKDTRTNFLHKLSTRLINENQVVVLEDLNTAGMIKNRRLSRAISDLGWRQFRTFLEGKAEKLGREFRVISRWEPTSQTCSVCRFRGGKLDLSIREWECLNCGTIHDRDTNAAINILVAGGHPETKQNGRGGTQKTAVKAAASDETSTRLEFKPKQLSLFDLDGWESSRL